MSGIQAKWVLDLFKVTAQWRVWTKLFTLLSFND